MRSKVGALFMILGAAMIVAALSLLLHNRSLEQAAADSVEAVLPEVLDIIQERTEVWSADSEDMNGEVFLPDPLNPEMVEAEIDGNMYIGCLSIPALGLELPVLSEWDYTHLEIAPCRYSGSTKTDDLVIAAHNYTQHFGKLSTLQPGDTVIFTDIDGITTAYQVVELDTLSPTSVEEMCAGDYDLSLFTCTYGGKNRTTVRCDRTE